MLNKQSVQEFVTHFCVPNTCSSKHAFVKKSNCDYINFCSFVINHNHSLYVHVNEGPVFPL